jgi:hypothetical protein
VHILLGNGKDPTAGHQPECSVQGVEAAGPGNQGHGRIISCIRHDVSRRSIADLVADRLNSGSSVRCFLPVRLIEVPHSVHLISLSTDPQLSPFALAVFRRVRGFPTGFSPRIMLHPHDPNLFDKLGQPKQASVERIHRLVDAGQRVPNLEDDLPWRVLIVVAGDPQRRSVHR